MKILISIILISVGLMGISAQTTKPDAQLSPALQEAAKLSGELVSLFRQKKFDEALPLAQKVVEIREKESGKTHLSVGQAWSNLAYIQQRRGASGEAEKAFERAFDIYESNQPLAATDEKVFAELLDVVATYQANDGKLENAEKKLQRSLELREKFYGKDALETSDSLLKLAQVQQLSGSYGKAAPLFLRALDIRAAKLSATNDATRDVYNNAHCALTKLGDEEQAKQLREKFYPPKANNLPTIKGVPITIQSGIVNGKALVLAKPPYPAEARAKRASGAVSVQVTIDETGKVVFACALTGMRELHRASEIAAYNSKFSPTTLDGKTVRVSGVIVYNFVAGGR
jgi:tetratricopeptide (TPR) repeat protein